jgi:predicted Zn-dependent peptidase
MLVVGDVDPAQIDKQVRAVFGGWKAQGSPPPLPQAPQPSAGERRILLVDRPGSTQSHIVVGRLAPIETDPRYFAALVGSTILGGMSSARIMTNLREEKGWSYTPSSEMMSFERAAVLQLSADVRSDMTAPSLSETFLELDRMKSAPPTVEELERAKRYQIGLHLVRNQMQETLSFALAKSWVLGLPPRSLSQFVDHLRAVTLDEVMRVGEALFPSLTPLVVVVVGDAQRVMPSLRRLGKVTLVSPGSPLGD